MKYIIKLDSKQYVSRADPSLLFTRDEGAAMRFSRAAANTVAGMCQRQGHRTAIIEVQK